MFVAAVVLFMFVLPLLSVAIDIAVTSDHGALIDVIGKWFVFWAVGVRLFTAGVRQIIRPGLTSEGILGIEGQAAWQLVRELGFANVSIGLVAIVSLWHPAWREAGALAGGLFLLLAGLEHVAKKPRGFDARLAMGSDLAIAGVMAWYVVATT